MDENEEGVGGARTSSLTRCAEVSWSRLQVFVVGTPPVPCHLGVLLLDIVLVEVDVRIRQHPARCYGSIAAVSLPTSQHATLT